MNPMSEIDARSNLTANNQFELFLFRLGVSQSAVDDVTASEELYGINVFKVREIIAMPEITTVAEAGPHILGVVNIRGQIITVIDLPSAVGCVPRTGLNILIITEFARTTQAFAVESVDEIVRLDWNQVLPADLIAHGKTVSSIARLDGNTDNARLAQVLDVEQILRDVCPSRHADVDPQKIGMSVQLTGDAVILAADDSALARSLVQQSLDAIGARHVLTKTGKEAWEYLLKTADLAADKGIPVSSLVALVLTDLEMPEMDGFTLTRKIKEDARFNMLPVIVHSSLSGSTNEKHVRSVGADGYVGKFVASELASAIRNALASRTQHHQAVSAV